jgi:uncharacterized membrane protein
MLLLVIVLSIAGAFMGGAIRNLVGLAAFLIFCYWILGYFRECDDDDNSNTVIVERANKESKST